MFLSFCCSYWNVAFCCCGFFFFFETLFFEALRWGMSSLSFTWLFPDHLSLFSVIFSTFAAHIWRWHWPLSLLVATIYRCRSQFLLFTEESALDSLAFSATYSHFNFRVHARDSSTALLSQFLEFWFSNDFLFHLNLNYLQLPLNIL